ncbi:hypothetical protein SAMN05878482_12113 [Peribacillus simplex]|uniref:Acyl-CoA dehydrogenase n=1 Tax=Peribacillus simplex TaxID=1478 RepID=A0A9X8WNM8_9BACI|nr:acyl-CoA dehydrogenase family protein [Peribacillus simplex]SIS14515.1 hypothetical protein SAMN05878482_12113 [Peribacillus simplex]
MDLKFTDEQELIRKMARYFSQSVIAPAVKDMYHN